MTDRYFILENNKKLWAALAADVVLMGERGHLHPLPPYDLAVIG